MSGWANEDVYFGGDRFFAGLLAEIDSRTGYVLKAQVKVEWRT
jgi:hypothetical protein